VKCSLEQDHTAFLVKFWNKHQYPVYEQNVCMYVYMYVCMSIYIDIDIDIDIQVIETFKSTLSVHVGQKGSAQLCLLPTLMLAALVV
jgi:hypothetical protein